MEPATAPPVPGKRTLTESMTALVEPRPPRALSGSAAPAPVAPRTDSAARPTLQMLFRPPRVEPSDPARLRAVAARGAATPASRLPHADQIQRAFGRHDVSGIQAHVGPGAAASARSLGARAYAIGDHVVLGEATDLHTVAHEAAHVVQQRAGVQLTAGVGAAGDEYERHADAVAELVVQGQSAEPLLDRFASTSRATAPAVQRKIEGFDYERVSTAPDDVIAAVSSDGSFAAGLTPPQLTLLCTLINAPDVLTLDDVRQRLRALGAQAIADRHPDDAAAQAHQDSSHQPDDAPPIKPGKREELDDEDAHVEGSRSRASAPHGVAPSEASNPTAAPAAPAADSPEARTRVSATLLRSTPGYLRALLDNASRLADDAALHGVRAGWFATEVARAWKVVARPVEELLAAIEGLSVTELDEVAGALGGDPESRGHCLLGDYNLEGEKPRVQDAVERQRGLHAHFRDLGAAEAARLLDDRRALTKALTARPEKPADAAVVLPQIEATLQLRIARELSGARTANDLPKDAANWLQASQGDRFDKVLAPGQISKATSACALTEVMMVCKIDGQPPEVAGRALERVLKGKSLKEYLAEAMNRDQKMSPQLAAGEKVGVARRMEVPGHGAWLRVDCKLGLRWVQESCVKVDDHKYEAPRRGPSKVGLYGSAGRPEVADVEQGRLGNCYLMAALIAVVSRRPKSIVEMLSELDTDHVAVRLFRYEGNTPVADWIRVSRKVVMQDGKAIYAGVTGALWPAIIEKAFAARSIRATGAGLEALGQGGKCSSVFAALLGDQATEVELARPKTEPATDHAGLGALPHNPLLMPAEQVARMLYTPPDGDEHRISSDDVTDRLNLVNQLAASFARRASAAYTQLEKSARGEDRQAILAAVSEIARGLNIENALSKLMTDPIPSRPDAKVAQPGDPAPGVTPEHPREPSPGSGSQPPWLSHLCAHVERHTPAPAVASGKYSTRGQMLHMQIRSHLQRGGAFALATKSWDSNERGPSGEPLSATGLAGMHAYAVIAAPIVADRLMLTIRNPWGRNGMAYRARSGPSGKAETNDNSADPGLERVPITAPQFDLDIDDVLRFFSKIYVAKHV